MIINKYAWYDSIKMKFPRADETVYLPSSNMVRVTDFTH